MLTAILSLVGALVFGSADFLGGLSSRRISPLLATGVAAFTGLIALLIAIIFTGGAWSPEAALWGGLSGVSGALAISLLYACLAVGPMSILSPLTAVISAIVPLAWGLIGGDALTPLGYLALGLALVAVILVGFVPEKGAVRPSVRGILMAVGSGTFIGIFLILLDATPDDSGLIPLVFNRLVNGCIMFATIAVLWAWRRRRRHAALRQAQRRRTSSVAAGTSSVAEPAASVAEPVEARTAIVRAGLLLAIACGIVDALGNALIVFSLRLGDLSIVAVLTAMYPAGTIILAAIVLRERIAPVQWVGLLLALAAAGMLALA